MRSSGGDARKRLWLAAVLSLAACNETTSDVTPAANLAPLCVVADAPLVVCAFPGASVQLDGLAASDPDGDRLSYAWSSDCPAASFDDPTVAQPLLTLPSSLCGLACTATLRVSDALSSSSCATSIVVAPNLPPTCAIETATVVDCQGTVTILQASAASSSDPEGAPLAFQWSVDGDGIVISDPTGASTDLLVSTVDCRRKFTLSLRVSDGESFVSCAQPIEIVRGAAFAPRAAAMEPTKLGEPFPAPHEGATWPLVSSIPLADCAGAQLVAVDVLDELAASAGAASHAETWSTRAVRGEVWTLRASSPATLLPARIELEVRDRAARPIARARLELTACSVALYALPGTRIALRGAAALPR